MPSTGIKRLDTIAAKEISDIAETLQNVNIILIDPDVDSHHRLSRSLGINSNGLKVYLKGHPFLNSVQSHSCDLYIIELDLPDIDGLKLLKQLREVSISPTLIYTKRNDIGSAVEVMRYPYTDYIEKPGLEVLIRSRALALMRQSSQGDSGNRSHTVDNN